MATMAFSAAGSSLGASIGGSVLGMSAATLGQAAGGVVGALVDQKLMGRGSQSVDTGRIDSIRLQGANEGHAIPQLFGRMRIAGQVIWASRFTEHVDESGGGGKGGRRVRNHDYTVSFAVALCEGKIQRIGRLWADGNEVSLGDFTYRLHRGGPGQLPDPLIETIEGEAPAFRGVAYIVFEDVSLAPFGNRIPQFNVEVWREPAPAVSSEEQRRKPLSEMLRAVALSPGSGEFSLETKKVRRIIGPGATAFENVNTISERPDLPVSLDQLESEAPECKAVSLIVSWFGDDLRCGKCDIRPSVENDDKETDPVRWEVSGVGRGGARIVSQDDRGRPIFGGTPSDGSVIRAIREMRRRGMKVMFYPFILMDVPPGNAKTDPWTGSEGQPAFPWRGRITLNRAPGVAGSPDKTAAAGAQVSTFFGNAARAHFSPEDDTVGYSGPSEWSFRRFILHYAHLCAIAGGVDSFCIGSEMRGLTQIRDGASSYPAVAALRRLASDARAILGPDAKIGYAADWSEYFGHHPQDGSGDVFFHLDPLWADDDIDFVGIDNYLPLSDWRYEDGHADEAEGSVYSLSYLDKNIEGGEGYDWYYANANARNRQIRTPILDTAHGEHWIFRPKDIRNWWSERHYNRPGGVRASAATAWTPMSKPIWFTEIGCPAVDLGANQPNVFVDPKSSENALPYFSRGVRDDYMQRRYLQAVLSHWNKAENNPVSPVYDKRMIWMDRAFVWTWDARPWPDFPDRLDVWSDGPNHRLGHWLSGRLGAASLADVVEEICLRSGLKKADVSELHGVVQGYMLDEVGSARAALQSLMTAFAFDAIESGDSLRFRHRDRPVDMALSDDDLVGSANGGRELSFTRTPEGELPAAIRFGYLDSERDYEVGALEARAVGSRSTREETSKSSVLMDSASAQDVADRQLREIETGRDSAAAALGKRMLALEPGDIVSFPETPGAPRFRIDRIDDTEMRALTLTRVEPSAYLRRGGVARKARPKPTAPAAPVVPMFLDLPSIGGEETGPHIAAFAEPWASTAAVYAANAGDSFQETARIVRPAAMGVLTRDLASSAPHLWSRGADLEVRLFGGALSAKPELAVLNGANLAAIGSPSGEWELLQFQEAELIADKTWRLSRLLRGQAGTEVFIGDVTPAGAAFVLLDDALAEVAVPASLRGVERYWRVGPSRKPYTHDSYVEFAATDEGKRLRPYAPAHLRAVRDPATQDIRVSWIRRARLGGDAWVEVDPPLNEERERYRVRIGDVREIETGVTSWNWSASAQAADGVSGFVEIGVSQLSDRFGYGPESKVTIHV